MNTFVCPHCRFQYSVPRPPDALKHYSAAIADVDTRLGAGASAAIINLIARWNALGDVNGNQKTV